MIDSVGQDVDDTEEEVDNVWGSARVGLRFWFWFSSLHKKMGGETAKTATWTSQWVFDTTLTSCLLYKGGAGQDLGSFPMEGRVRQMVVCLCTVLSNSLYLKLQAFAFFSQFSSPLHHGEKGWGQLCEHLHGAWLQAGPEPQHQHKKNPWDPHLCRKSVSAQRWNTNVNK